MRKKQRRAVVYAVNSRTLYLSLVKRSIESLRSFSPKIPVLLVIFGSVADQRLKKFEQLQVQIYLEPRMPRRAAESLKWFALEKAKEFREVLFVDADTFFVEPVERVFDVHQEADFYAFPEFAIDKPHRRGDTIIPRRVDPQVMTSLRREFKSRPVPVFNSSLMLFRNFLTADIILELPLFVRLFGEFHNKMRPYPCRTIFMVDEILGSVLVGMMKNRKVAIFQPGTVTHFNDWICNWDTDIGVVIHIGHSLVVQFDKFFDIKLNRV